MISRELREKYLKFFENKRHKVIPSAPLVPENDASTLFVSAGMQPLVPYLLGQEHPEGTRLVNCQKCIRTGDIDEVGDAFHHTFFEMLGNWSLGDYFKKESIPWSYEFLTQELNISSDRLSVSVFAGDDDAPRDEEAAELWKSVGIPEDRIYFFGKEDNWWAAGPTGPCGPDTEIFYDVTQKPCGSDCRPGDNCGRYFEIWNNVFMVYNRKEDGTLEELPKKNVDTGMGMERTLAVLNKLEDNYKTDLFWPIIEILSTDTELDYEKNRQVKDAFRITADHVKASVFLFKDGIHPDNKMQGYILRRLLRRAVVMLESVKKGSSGVIPFLVDTVINIYQETNYFTSEDKARIKIYIELELDKFKKTLSNGMKEVQKIENVDGKQAFDLYQTYGFPLELTEELFREKGQEIDHKQFEEEFEKHRELSRTASAGMFKGGLAGDTPETRKYHTAAHLLQASLRKILGDHVEQAGQNITDERLRFDFKHTEALTQEEIKLIGDQVNQVIEKDLPVTSRVMSLGDAYKEGALGFFKDKYGEQVSVYTVGNESNFFSKEICGGPHVTHTGEIGHVTITKEESAGSGVRRLYITLK